ncbi:MAG: bifunctional riboflavin kinase/FAD synthetase [Chloroflexi bacterium]|nr:MAG: bifunctional riboflavin kinase/FAD synthetase [Chloroflexota bacterium]
MTQSVIRVSDLRDVTPDRPTFLAIGSFDGVHRGHQSLLREMVQAARAAGCRAAVLTFFPHPRRVIQNLTTPYYITTLEDRVSLLAESGIDLIITQPFTEQVRRTRAAEFVEQLCQYLNLRALWGGNFALGYQREGDLPFLQRLGAEKGFEVHVVPALVTWAGELVSSSRVRRGLQAGDMEDVNGCLGRPFHLSGVVIEGDKRGRTIGVPTANLQTWEEQLLPANGVYATVARIGDKRYLAATNIGVRPTVSGKKKTVEAHLLDFEGDLYHQSLTLEFWHFIRSEQKFDSLDALKAQIQTDIIRVRELLQKDSQM